MEAKEFIEKVVESLNEEGLQALACLCEVIGDTTFYKKGITFERCVDDQEEEKVNEQLEGEEDTALNKARRAYRMKEEFIYSLCDNEKKLFKKVDSVEMNPRYDARYWEAKLLCDANNNSLMNGFNDVFRFGYLKGQKAERARWKNAATC